MVVEDIIKKKIVKITINLFLLLDNSCLYHLQERRVYRTSTLSIQCSRLHCQKIWWTKRIFGNDFHFLDFLSLSPFLHPRNSRNVWKANPIESSKRYEGDFNHYSPLKALTFIQGMGVKIFSKLVCFILLGWVELCGILQQSKRKCTKT